MTGRLRPCVGKVLRLLALMCLGAFLPTEVAGQTIVWTEQRKIQSKDTNGGPIETIVQFSPSQFLGQIHYDPLAAKLYYLFIAGGSFSFQRCNPDGSNPETIPTPSAGSFTLNVDSRKLYWIEGFNDTVHRAELDGSGLLSHTYSDCCVLCLEAFGSDLFFGGGLTLEKGIWRADADGSNEQFLEGTGTGSGAPLDLAHDPVDSKLYWLAQAGLFRVNLDGSGKENLVFLLPDDGDQLIVDPWGRKLYWTYEGKKIQRSNLDGSNVEDFVSAAQIPNADLRGLAIVYTPTPIPALSRGALGVLAVFLVVCVAIVLRKRVPITGAAGPVTRRPADAANGPLRVGGSSAPRSLPDRPSRAPSSCRCSDVHCRGPR